MQFNEETTQTTLRFPNELKEQINKMAKENDRSFSKQVIYMLKKYIEIKKD